MIVIVNSECVGPSAVASQRILDDFFPRLGRRSWCGRITTEGLNRLRKMLSRRATKATSICCHRVTGKTGLKVEWFVGNRLNFNSLGHCNVFTSAELENRDYIYSNSEELILAIVCLSALFHDLGKFTIWFQRKLRQAAKNNARIADLIRHEVISLAVLRAMFEIAGGTDDAFLANLFQLEDTRSLIAKAFNAVADLPGYYITGNEEYRKYPEKFLQSLRSDTNHIEISIPTSDVDKSKFSMMCAVTLTHHRLPDGVAPKRAEQSLKIVLKGRSGMFSGRFDSDTQLAQLVKENTTKWDGPALWDDDLWISDINKTAKRLSELSVFDHTSELRLAATVGRTALIIGDHKASEVGSTTYPRDSDSYPPDVGYANTSKIVPNALAEPLSPHMRRVYREARNAFQLFTADRNQFPSIHHDDLPECISHPRAATDSKFRWQSEARKTTRSAIKHAGPTSGFFGVLMSETGSGKTRAAPIIMAAANMHEGVRFSLVSGLRSLTLQSGKEYIEDLKLPESSVSVLIGDALTRDLHNLTSSSPIGTSSEGSDKFLTWSPSDAVDPLPIHAQRLFGKAIEAKNEDILSKPVVVSTIDMLMSAADARRGRHTMAMLRIATSDLIIDEIDNFGEEDIAAISRLIHTSATFGRKVLIASATVGETIMKTLHRAYMSGWELHKQMSGTDCPVVTGLYSNVCDSSVFVDESPNLFHDKANAFIKDYIDKLTIRPVKRIAARLPFENYTVDGVFNSVTRCAVDLHKTFRIKDPKTGKWLSIGVVRWNNVRPSVQYAHHLASFQHDDICLKMIPYNGTLLPVVRHELERQLNPMLKRRPINGVDPVFSNSAVRSCLDSTDKNDVMIVVITTSMEETGRDHDFDWCITEPGTMRGLIQMCGRVLRHRDAMITSPNILIMEKPFRWIERHNNLSQALPLSLPGIETPIHGLNNKDITAKSIGIAVDSYDASDLFDLDRLATGVTSADLITFEESSHFILQLERKRINAVLNGVLNASSATDHLAITDFLTDPHQAMTAHHATHRRFRRQSGINVGYYFDTHSPIHGWKAIVEKTKDRFEVNTKIKNVDLPEDNLFFKFDDIEMLQEKIAKELDPTGNLPFWKRDVLLTVDRQIHSFDQLKSVEFLYNKNLGLLERKPWLTYLEA